MQKEISPVFAIVAAVVILAVLAVVFLRAAGRPTPKKTTEELRQSRPAPKIPPLGPPPQ